MSDIIKFEFDQPVEVALRYVEPKVFASQFAGGDDRYMYSTTDGRIMYHTPLTAAKIKALNVAVGEAFFVVKVKAGRLTEYNVFREADAPAPAPRTGLGTFGGHKKVYPPHTSTLPDRLYAQPAAVAAAPAPAPAAAPEPASELEKQLAASIELVKARKAAAETPAWVATLTSQTNHVLDAYAASLQHASKYGIASVAVKPEDVRSILLSVFINLSQQKNRAA